MSKRDVDKYFPRNGPCFCHKTRYARHRVIDAIKERFFAGERIESLMNDYDLPREAIKAAIRSTPDDNRLTAGEMRKAA